MALKTDCIIFGFIRHIEFFGEVVAENAEEGAAVRIMTGVTIAVFDRPMLMLLCRHILRHLFVAGEAEFHLWSREHKGIIRGVNIMTCAAVALLDRAVLVFYAGVALDVIVTSITETGLGLPKQELGVV